MYPPHSWSTPWTLTFHRCLEFSLLFLSPFEMNVVCILLRYRNMMSSIREFRYWPPRDRPGLGNLDHPVCRILLTIIVFSWDGRHQSLNRGIQCLGAVLFHHFITLWMFGLIWKQPHRLKTPVMEWMESRHCSDLMCKSNSLIQCNAPADTIFRLVPIGLIKNPNHHEQCESWPLLDGFALDVEVSYETRWFLHRFSGSSIFVFRSSWVRYPLSTCSKWISSQSVPYVISSMTLLNILATRGIVTTSISSNADVSTRCPCSGVDLISERRHGNEVCLCNRYHACLSPIILGNLFSSIFTHLWRVLPHKIDNGNPTATLSVGSLHIIAAAAEVKVLPSPISSATSAPGGTESHTHLRTMNHIERTWCARHIVLCRPGIVFLWPRTVLLVDWPIG